MAFNRDDPDMKVEMCATFVYKDITLLLADSTVPTIENVDTDFFQHPETNNYFDGSVLLKKFKLAHISTTQQSTTQMNFS